MDDGETFPSKYPNVGATCQLQIGGLSLVMIGGEPDDKTDDKADTVPAAVIKEDPVIKPVAWEKDTLPDCPEDESRTRMDDGKTHVSKYPNVGATCKLQIGEMSLIMMGKEEPEAKGADGKPVEKKTVPVEAAVKADESGKPAEKKEDFSALKGLEHCPDFNERFTLVNGRTRAIAYPNSGFNCSIEYGLA
jgi:hypothetical protein